MRIALQMISKSLRRQVMANNKRLFLSLPEDDVARLDMLRTELGMNRSQYGVVQ